MPHVFINNHLFRIMNIANIYKCIAVCFSFFIDVAYCNLSDYYFEALNFNLKRIETNLKNDNKNVFYAIGKGHDYLLVNVFGKYSKNGLQDIKLYNKAWFAKRSFDYDNSRRLLLEALKATDNLNLKREIIADLTVVESMLEFDIQELRKNERVITYNNGKNNAGCILNSHNTFLKSLIERCSSPFSKECYYLFKQIHEHSPNLKQVHLSILSIDDKQKRDFCLHLFFYCYETGINYENKTALKLANDINEYMAYYVIANSADFFDGYFVKNYDNWVTSKILYDKAFKISGNSFFKNCLYADLPELSKEGESKFEKLLSETWEIKQKHKNE